MKLFLWFLLFFLWLEYRKEKYKCTKFEYLNIFPETVKRSVTIKIVYIQNS